MDTLTRSPMTAWRLPGVSGTPRGKGRSGYDFAYGHPAGGARRAAHPRSAPNRDRAVGRGGRDPKEPAARAGHTSVAFALDPTAACNPDADEALRDRLSMARLMSPLVANEGPHLGTVTSTSWSAYTEATVWSSVPTGR